MAERDGAVVGYLAHDALDHGRLALAIAAHEGYLVATLYGEGGILIYESIVCFAHPIGNHGIAPATGRGRELEAQA